MSKHLTQPNSTATQQIASLTRQALQEGATIHQISETRFSSSPDPIPITLQIRQQQEFVESFIRLQINSRTIQERDIDETIRQHQDHLESFIR